MGDKAGKCPYTDEMLKGENKCRVCGTGGLMKVFSEGEYEIWECLRCGFGTISPMPSDEEIFQIYQGDYHCYVDGDDVEADAKKKYQWVSSWIKPTIRVLDWGCGEGYFVQEVRDHGGEAEGYDISLSVAKKAKKKFGIKIKTKRDFEGLYRQGEFGLITIFDVIEHIVDFRRNLKAFHQWLVRDGVLIMTTPDMDSWERRLLSKRWYGYTRIPQHVNYFGESSLGRVLEETGFEVEKCVKWGFVRKLSYLAQQIDRRGRLAQLLTAVGVGQVKVYLPLSDMMIVAKKK